MRSEMLRTCVLLGHDCVWSIGAACVECCVPTSSRCHTYPAPRHPSPFTASFSPSSDPEISVQPTNGDLAPVNTRGTLFCVTYKPTTYGRDHHAKLIVQVGLLCDVTTAKRHPGINMLFTEYRERSRVCCHDSVASIGMSVVGTHANTGNTLMIFPCTQ